MIETNEMTVEQETFMCPECGENSMSPSSKNVGMFSCSNCGVQINGDILMMSYELLEKEIALKVLKDFLEPGIGKCIQYGENTFVVGFTIEGELVVIQHDLGEGQEVGMYVKIHNKPI